MILGITGKTSINIDIVKNTAENMRLSRLVQDNDLMIWADKKNTLFWHDKNTGSAAILVGELFNLKALTQAAGLKADAESLWKLWNQKGTGFFDALNGQFILFFKNGRSKTAVCRDQIGIYPLFYREIEEGLAFSSSLSGLKSINGKMADLNTHALLSFLMFCYNPGKETFFKNIHKLRPGYVLQKNEKQYTLDPYWKLSFKEQISLSENQIADEIRAQLADAVRIRSSGRSSGAFLSGGLDSSSIVSLFHREGGENMRTFSFRCKGESFDESPYAKRVADAFHTNHHLVEYGPEEVFLADEMTALMDEPFCDVGINVATFLLAKNAAGKVDDIFTGDGGDELFGGHPVYSADKAAAKLAWIPNFLLKPVFFLGRQIPDSDRKKDWRVKIKRFSESYSFPKALGTHRWRVYYTVKMLKNLVSPDVYSQNDADHIFDEIINYNREADGQDMLARSLYSDYQTAVQFYLRRMDMARKMGLNPRFPMLDPNVIKYCAAIPSDLKLRGMSDTKYIERLAVDPLLPHDVVHRKDKLGHSIPLKNWMRDHEKVRGFMLDLLNSSSLRNRGLFNTDNINKMIDGHHTRKRNNSHRLWALMVLELWMRRHFDTE